MEKKIYDLNEYSLEVKDGKAVLKRKRREFKPGDVLVGPWGQVVIYAGTIEKAILTYCGYNTDVFSYAMGKGWGYTEDFHYASKEQKAILFAEIKKRGYVWDAKNLELRKNTHGRTDFKHGDFICFGSGCIGIYKDKAKNGELFWTRCFLGNDKFTSYGSSHPFTEMRLASEEERKRLLDAIDKEGLFWDSEKLELRKKFDFDDGAFVADADGDLFIHWEGGDTCYSHGSYVFWDRDNDDVILECAGNMTTGDRPATRDEICALFDRLAKDGLAWDRENKITKKKRWRAKKGKEYWHAEFGQGITRAFSSVEMGREVDDFRYGQGNYYMSEYDVLRDIDEVENKKDSK